MNFASSLGCSSSLGTLWKARGILGATFSSFGVTGRVALREGLLQHISAPGLSLSCPCAKFTPTQAANAPASDIAPDQVRTLVRLPVIISECARNIQALDIDHLCHPQPD